MTTTTKNRDGFEVVSINTNEIVHFVECSYDGRMREKVETGLVHKTDLDRFFVRDTRFFKTATEYEYAGFKYTIIRDTDGNPVDMHPLPGQHHAAGRDKNVRNALQMFKDGL